jgi:adenosylcobinamide kinase / adenosylcobinamide-phosphate guanylyltransferase
MPSRGKLVFVTGAARSGKSFFAEKMAAQAEGRVTYIATCVPGDQEMVERVNCHQARRPVLWETVEEALDPARVIKKLDDPGNIFLLDCLTLLVSNLLLQDDRENSEEQILNYIAELARIGYESAALVIIVSNEVGAGIVPGDPLSRTYRDIIGRANQTMAAYADEAYITIAGIPLELKALGRVMVNNHSINCHIE